MAETMKSYQRRVGEGWFDKYAPSYLSGIDVICGADIGEDYLNQTFRRFHGDVQRMTGIDDNQFHTVFAGHVLEHVENPIEAVYQWYRICKSPGHIIICVPHRDLYEKKLTLPSQWNEDHKTYWLPDIGEPPVTRGLREVILQAKPKADIISLRVLDEGWFSNGSAHSDGEYSIEAIIRK